MIIENEKAIISSFETLGAVDGPGLRFVIFSQGCPLRCGCCHNPETWDYDKGTKYSIEELVNKTLRYKNYFGKNGGITVSGGEPLLQAKVFSAVFKTLKEKGINTCLDTSGCILNDDVKTLLEYTDRVLLDVKYTKEALYKKHVGCSFKSVLEFLNYLDEKKIKTTIRQVIIPTLNDDEENALKLIDLKNKFRCIDKIELLPFKKICKTKYDTLSIPFPFNRFNTPSNDLMYKLNKLLN